MVEAYDITPPQDLKMRLEFLSVTDNLISLSLLWEAIFF